MLLSPRRRLVLLLALVCALPILTLTLVYHRLPALRAARSSSTLSPTVVQPDDSLLPPTRYPPPKQPQTPPPINMSKAAVEQKISASRVVVFSKSYCPYCRATKDLLSSLGEDFDVYELDQLEDGSDWQAYLGEKTGQRTVPSVWIGGEFKGGNSDLQALHKSGELKKLLA